MKHILALLYFLIGLLLGTWAVFSHAETIAATGGYKDWNGTAGYPTVVAACQASCSQQASYAQSQGSPGSACVAYTSTSGVACYGTVSGGGTINYFNPPSGYMCPSGQNWTLSGQTCSRPDCVAPSVRQADGTCQEPNPCASKAGQSKGDGYVSTAVGSSPPTGTNCDGTCEVNTILQMGPEMLLSKGKEWWPVSQTYTGNKCSASSDTVPAIEPTNKAPANPPKTPPCASGEGVMTSSSGSIKCVPEGVPDAAKTVVKKEKKVETYPDGTTKGTETTTTKDPNTGATHSTTSSTATGKADSTAGQAGSVGTTTTTGGSSTSSGGGGGGSGDGDGECDPTLQMCGSP